MFDEAACQPHFNTYGSVCPCLKTGCCLVYNVTVTLKTQNLAQPQRSCKFISLIFMNSVTVMKGGRNDGPEGEEGERLTAATRTASWRQSRRGLQQADSRLLNFSIFSQSHPSISVCRNANSCYLLCASA